MRLRFTILRGLLKKSGDYVYAFGQGVALTDVEPLRTVIGRGFNLTTNAIIVNMEEYSEDLVMTAYANATLIETKIVSIAAHNSAIVPFIWVTSAALKGRYLISVNASAVSGENHMLNNNITNGYVTLTIPSDVDGDFFVGIIDLSAVGRYWQKRAPPSANADVNRDGVINIQDISQLGLNWYKHA